MIFSACSLCYPHFRLRVGETVIFLFWLHWVKGRLQPGGPSHAMAPSKALERPYYHGLHLVNEFCEIWNS